MAELKNLLALLRSIQRRATWNVFLREYARWVARILAGLLLAAALSPQLYWAFVAAGVLVLAGLAASAGAARKKQPDLYQAGQMGDRAAGLKDRLSTAVYFAKAEAGDNPLIFRQRADAVRHAARIDPAKLFPVRTPVAARYALALLLAVAALFAYRLHSSPPLLALLQRAAQTRVVRAIVAPIVQAMNRNESSQKGRASASQTQSSNQQSAVDSRSRGAESGDKHAGVRRAAGDPSQAEARGDKQEQQREQQQEAQNTGQQGQQQEGQEGSEQQGQQQGRQPQQGNGKQQQRQDGQSGQQSGRDSEGASGRNQSLAQSLMQAVKNLFSRPNANQTAPAQGQMSSGKQQQAQNGSSSQAGQQAQQGQGNQATGQQGQQAGQGQPPQQNQKNGTGIGTEAGSQQPGAATDFLGVNGRPDTVDVPIQQFSGQAQVRARVGDGVVTTPARGAGAPAVSSPAGAEQENIPLRYRAYLQRYFDHAKK